MLELKVYLYLHDAGIKFELAKHRIKYKIKNIDKKRKQQKNIVKDII
jgi:hypothetical protein